MPNDETTLGMITRRYYLTTRPYTFKQRSATVKESPYSALVSTTNFVKHCDIVSQGLYRPYSFRTVSAL